VRVNTTEKTAYKLKFIPATPSVPGSKNTYPLERSFILDNIREITAQESVRAGRDASNKGKRFYYYPRMVSFAYGDRVRYLAKDYEILWIPDSVNAQRINYIDTRAIQ
jgi:hypothetical protein